MADTTPRFAPGDRVLFVGDHPWVTHSGTISEPMTTPVGDGWAVEIDGQLGHRAFAQDRNLHPITKRGDRRAR